MLIVLGRARLCSSGWDSRQLGEFAEVLDCGGQEELVSGTVGTSEAKLGQAKDTFEMGGQHLNLFFRSRLEVT
jgi:hypothetical protein